MSYDLEVIKKLITETPLTILGEGMPLDLEDKVSVDGAAKALLRLLQTSSNPDLLLQAFKAAALGSSVVLNIGLHGNCEEIH